ncbi:MAG: hypothetical protein MUD14_13395 [Hydrococcus sp. Prado102]|nr:hypothetical protein [Hydrococcus sp. Prado102]
MTHSFLVEAGRWSIEGHWLERNGIVFPVKGRTLVAWTQENWFTMVTKLVFPDSDRPEISSQSRGRLDPEEDRYTYVLQQSLLGQVEGEGWIGPESIVQRYWVLGDRQKRSGFETFYRVSDNAYHLSGGLIVGHSLANTIEAVLERQP